MPAIYIEGREYEVRAGDNLLHACLSLGLDVPYFCWHPAMGSVGACRQCAIKQFKDENDTRGMLAMACMAPVKDGARISIEDEQARRFRAGVIEFLMANHPHDCPVCEEGGECHLQDMTLMTGHAYRRFRFRKRTFRNQDLGPCIGHEMNRCITCYRCVRFYRDYAGGRDLHAMGVHDHVYFGREQDGTLESEFSGNLAEVCPTGVFTDKTLSARYARKWDLRATPSICVHCSLGCNTSPNARHGEVRRILNRYNGAVNGYFLCDRGRFGYDFVNRADRLRRPLLRADGASPTPLDASRAIESFAELARAGRAIGIGSPRASLEANFALRTLVGENGFFAGVASAEDRIVRTMRDVLRRGPARTPSLREVEDADAILVLGEDVPNTTPRLALSLRQAARNASFAEAARKGIPRWQDASVRDATPGVRSPIFLLTPDATRMDDIAAETVRATPDDVARWGFAVAHALDQDAPDADLPEDARAQGRRIAYVLGQAERPLVVSGAGCGSGAVVQAAANMAWALHRKGRPAGLCYALPECNSMGLALLDPRSLDDALAAVRAGEVDTVIVLENDLYRRAPKPAVDALFDAARQVVVLDSLHTATVDMATLALPAGTFAEADGTLVSAEGRAQRFFQLTVPEDDVQESWRWLRDAMVAAGRNEAAGWERLDDLTAACAADVAALAGIEAAAPGADFRINGMRVPREPHRYSGRTAMHADRTVRDPKPPEDPDSPLSFTMEGYHGRPPGALTPFYWSPRWNSNEAINKFQEEVGGPLSGGDPGVRLIEPDGDAHGYFTDVPEAFAGRADTWLTVPQHHVFASEELSARSAPVAARAPEPYVAVNEADAARLGLEPGDPVDLDTSEGGVRLRLRVHSALPDGVAAALVGAPGLPMQLLPAWTRIARGSG
jgi:NADH-quinone oxidoreductase subunit G